MAEMETDAAVAARLRPLVEVLEAAHGERLRAVIGYGPWLRSQAPAATVLVVMDDAGCARLRVTAASVGQLRRHGLEPLFVDSAELRSSLDVFPLEFLDMRADYEVVHGEDVLADLELPRPPLRLQLEEDLRSARHCLRQEVARLGHRPRELRHIAARAFAGLTRCWRGLLALGGHDIPAAVDALLQAAATAYGLDSQILGKLRSVELGTWAPGPDEAAQVVDELDSLLSRLIDLVDTLEP